MACTRHGPARRNPCKLSEFTLALPLQSGLVLPPARAVQFGREPVVQVTPDRPRHTFTVLTPDAANTQSEFLFGSQPPPPCVDSYKSDSEEQSVACSDRHRNCAAAAPRWSSADAPKSAASRRMRGIRCSGATRICPVSGPGYQRLPKC